MSDSKPHDAFASPRFAQPATFMRLPHRTDLAGVDVAIFGVPFDSGTVYRPGTRLGPREIRAQSSLIRPYSHFQQISPFDELTVVDAGDVDVTPLCRSRRPTVRSRRSPPALQRPASRRSRSAGTEKWIVEVDSGWWA